MQRGMLQDIGMDLCHAIDAVGTHDGKTRHVDHTVLDDGQGTHLGIVVGETLPHILQMAMVDLLDDHVDAGQ